MKLSVEVLSLLRMKGTLAPTYWSSLKISTFVEVLINS